MSQRKCYKSFNAWKIISKSRLNYHTNLTLRNTCSRFDIKKKILFVHCKEMSLKLFRILIYFNVGFLLFVHCKDMSLKLFRILIYFPYGSISWYLFEI